MTRLQFLLLALIVGQVAAGAYLVVDRVRVPTPPLVKGEHLDSVAKEELQQLVDGLDCRDARGWHDLGRFYFAYGYYPEAEACYRRGAELSPDDADILYDWGFGLERLGRLDDAVEQLQKAIEAGSDRRRECQYVIGRCKLRSGDLPAAESAWRAAGDHAASLYERAKLLFRAGQAEQAIAILEKLEARSDGAYMAELLRGTAQVELGNLATADEHFDRSDRQRQKLNSPFDREVTRTQQIRGQFGLPNWLKRQEAAAKSQPEQVAKEIRAMLKREWNPDLADFLAELEVAAGGPDEGVRLLEQVVQREGPKPYYLWRLGGMLEFAGDAPAAIETCERALRMGPELSDAAQLYQMLAAAYSRAGDEENALRCRAGAERTIGVAALYDQQHAAAVQALQAAVASAPSDAAAWYYLAEAQRLSGDRAAALAAYAKCLKLDPQHGRAKQGEERATKLKPRS